MKSARRLYRLLLALGALGAAAMASVLATIVTNATWSPGAVVVVCQLTVGPVLAALLVVMAIVVARGARAAVREVRSERRARAGLRVVGPLDESGLLAAAPPGSAGRRRAAPVLVIRDPAPRAFCAGHLRPRVHVSTGALERLSPPQLRAVIATSATMPPGATRSACSSPASWPRRCSSSPLSATLYERQLRAAEAGLVRA